MRSARIRAALRFWLFLAPLGPVACGGQEFTFVAGSGVDAGSSEGEASLETSSGALDAPSFTENDGTPPSSCAGSFACVPGVPIGWTGPVEFFEGTVTPPPCDPGFLVSPAYDGNDKISAADAGCLCTCGPPSGVQCTAPAVSVFSSNGSTAACSASNACDVHALQAGSCTQVDFSAGCSGGPNIVSVAMPSATPSGGICTAQTIKNIPTVTWGVAGRACAPSQRFGRLDCPVLQVCAPKAAPPFSTGLCVERSGDVDCPMIGYTTKHVLYAGTTDTRDCTACACEAVTGASCTTQLEIFSSSSAACTGTATTLTGPQVCGGAVRARQVDVRLSLSPDGGQCTATNAQPTGNVVAGTPTTFCCVL